MQLSNTDAGGEVSYFWQIVDQPEGAVDSLSNPNIKSPTFTPKKEGTYKLRLTVNLALADEKIDDQSAYVLVLETLDRLPAAGERTEVDTTRGWAADVLRFYKKEIDQRIDYGTEVGQVNGAGLTRGSVLYVPTTVVIKSGLPGARTIRQFSLAHANVAAQMGGPLYILESGVDGVNPPANGSLIKVRKEGLLVGVTGTGTLYDPVYVSDLGQLSTTPGSIPRAVGHIVNNYAGAGQLDILIEGGNLLEDDAFGVLAFGNSATPTAAGTTYADTCFADRVPGSFISEHRLTRACRISRLSVACAFGPQAVGAGPKHDLTILKNGVASSLTVTVPSQISGGIIVPFQDEDMNEAHGFLCAKGDRIGMQCVTSAPMVVGAINMTALVEMSRRLS